MNIDWITIIPATLSSGTIIYLIVDRLFSRKLYRANVHKTEVASFDEEMRVIREIRLSLLEDIKSQKEQAMAEVQKTKDSISGEVASLNTQVTNLQGLIQSMQNQQQVAEEYHSKQLLQLSSTVQKQAALLNKMIQYWQLLCDKDCKMRHVPMCPLKDKDDE